MITRNFKIGEIFYLHEETLKIKYSSVNEKDHRPYILFMKKNKFGKELYYLLPLISKFAYSKIDNKYHLRGKKDYWLEVKYNYNSDLKESYIMIDQVLIMSISKFKYFVKQKIDKQKFPWIKKQNEYAISFSNTYFNAKIINDINTIFNELF